jgi:phosphoribosyl-dephospho-CoA transferase
MELRPHHLVRVRRAEDLLSGVPFPDWVVATLKAAPWVVVRRASVESGRVPVGVRGHQRGQRFATWLSLDKILDVIPPHVLVDPANWCLPYSQGLPPVLQSLLSITPSLEATGYSWGPTGSCGFELATGISSISENSDLDLLLEIPEPISAEAARSLLARLQVLSAARLDVQLSTPSGGVALAEFCKGETVLVKTAVAPVLQKISDLWD